MPFFAVTSRVDLDYAKILGFTEPGGSVWRFVNGILQETEAVAKIPGNTPVRSGELISSIRARRPVSRGRAFYTSGTVVAEAEHASYVHEGTYGPIMSSRPGGFMTIPPHPPMYPNWFSARSVSGQQANPFLSRALDSVLAVRLAGGAVNPF